MKALEAVIKTEHGSKYLQMMCKHFAHKVDVEYDKNRGFAALPPGACYMKADNQAITVYIESEKEEGIKRSIHIIEEHIVKYAWREALDIQWEEIPAVENKEALYAS